MGVKHFWINALLVTAIVWNGCTKQENSTIYTKTQLAPITNLRAYSASGAAVSLMWDPSVNVNLPDYYGVRLAVIDENGNTIIPGMLIPKPLTDTTVIGLNEGTIYKFDFVSLPTAGSSNYDTSTHVIIRWAPASRFPIASDSTVVIHEFDANGAALCGLQFFNIEGGLIGPRVFRVDSAGRAQRKIDVFLRELPNSAGIIVLQSAHLNPLLSDSASIAGAKHTRFSTFELLSPSLNTARTSPPEASTYVLDKVVMGPSAVNSGKMFYAVTKDTNYVRIFVQRNTATGTLIAGSPPTRSISIQISYQTIPKVIYAKPRSGTGSQGN